MWHVLSFNLVWIKPNRITPACRRQTTTDAKHARSRGHVNKKIDHISPTLKRLEFLPIRQRVDYKVSPSSARRQGKVSTLWRHLSTRRQGKAHLQNTTVWSTGHLEELLTEYVPTRNFRSAERNDLVISRIQLVVASRAFSVVAPSIWNSLPLDITTAKSVTVFRKGIKRICLAWPTNSLDALLPHL